MLFSLNAIGNVYSYVLMTVDRYIFIEKPLRYYAIMTGKRTTLAIVFIWMVNVAYTVSGIAWESNVDGEGPCDFVTTSLYRDGIPIISGIQRVVFMFFILAPIYGKITHTSLKLINSEPHFR